MHFQRAQSLLIIALLRLGIAMTICTQPLSHDRTYFIKTILCSLKPHNNYNNAHGVWWLLVTTQKITW